MQHDYASDEAVKKATGKNWNAWIKTIDRLGGSKMSHKEIARTLYDRKLIASGWWCQMVTVGYEHAKGRRTLGKTADAGFQVGAQKTVPLSAGEVWKKLVSPAGWKRWLGKKPEAFSVWKPDARMRFKWSARDWKTPSTIQVQVIPSGPKKSVIAIHQERLPSAAARAAMGKKWRAALERLAKDV